MKQSIDDLAYFGGPKLFTTVRPIGQLWRPDLSDFFRYSKSAFEAGRFTNNGPIVRELEGRLRSLHEVEHCVAYANASIAIIAVLETVANGRQGEVIMPSFTYSGLPHLAQWACQYPRFCDIDRETQTIDPQQVRKAINADTTAILAVHQVTSPCHVEELQSISDEADVPLVFDSVHGILCSHKSRPIGTFGVAEIFSLHATKILNGFEGGYVTTNDPELADKLRNKRNFGFIENSPG